MSSDHRWPMVMMASLGVFISAYQIYFPDILQGIARTTLVIMQASTVHTSLCTICLYTLKWKENHLLV
jgi:hypothetical protein